MNTQPSELTEMLSSRVKSAQAHRARALAAAAGLSVSEWIRRLIDREWRREAMAEEVDDDLRG